MGPGSSQHFSKLLGTPNYNSWLDAGEETFKNLLFLGRKKVVSLTQQELLR